MKTFIILIMWSQTVYDQPVGIYSNMNRCMNAARYMTEEAQGSARFFCAKYETKDIKARHTNGY